jgi:acyl-CoA synthetase (AMP-forming)/AMP-acid ligase II
VVGVPHPVFGEVPVAFLAPLPGSTLDPEAVRRHCAARLADFKVPVGWRLVETLPGTLAARY